MSLLRSACLLTQSLYTGVAVVFTGRMRICLGIEPDLFYSFPATVAATSDLNTSSLQLVLCIIYENCHWLQN